VIWRCGYEASSKVGYDTAFKEQFDQQFMERMIFNDQQEDVNMDDVNAIPDWDFEEEDIHVQQSELNRCLDLLNEESQIYYTKPEKQLRSRIASK